MTNKQTVAPPPLNEHPKYRREPSLGADRVFFVTKADAEGIMAIDAGTGFPLTKLEEMPEWGEGLVMALLAERLGYYNQKLGSDHPQVAAFLSGDTIAFEDLAWMARTSGGADFDIAASEEVRLQNTQELLQQMGVVAEVGGNTVIVGSTRTITKEELDKDADPVSLSEANATTAELAGQTGGVEDLSEQRKSNASGASQ